MFYTGDSDLRALERRNLQARAAAFAAVTHGFRRALTAMVAYPRRSR